MGPSGELVDYEPQLIGFTMLDSFVTVLYSAFSEKKKIKKDVYHANVLVHVYTSYTMCIY